MHPRHTFFTWFPRHNAPWAQLTSASSSELLFFSSLTFKVGTYSALLIYSPSLLSSFSSTTLTAIQMLRILKCTYPGCRIYWTAHALVYHPLTTSSCRFHGTSNTSHLISNHDLPPQTPGLASSILFGSNWSPFRTPALQASLIYSFTATSCLSVICSVFLIRSAIRPSSFTVRYSKPRVSIHI